MNRFRLIDEVSIKETKHLVLSNVLQINVKQLSRSSLYICYLPTYFACRGIKVERLSNLVFICSALVCLVA